MRKPTKRTATVLTCGFSAAAIGFGAMTLFAAPASAAPHFHPCICPQVYAPVTCDNGVTYPNSCYASCAHATGCVPGILF